MKKQIIFLLGFITVFQFQLAKAQVKISAGGGANFSNISITKVENFKTNSTTNYFLSVRPELIISEKLNIGLDIQFSRKGYNSEVNNNQEVAGYRFQYLDMIPQLQYKFIKQIGIFTGLGVAIRTSEKFNIGDIWRESVQKISKSSDFTYVFGIRVYPLEKLALHFQYAGSLSSISNLEFTDDQGQTVEGAAIYLKNLQIGLTYQLF
ncbi:MAG: outer membrane beta-barrel protein [Saprospiraceae bacterium]|nr:outer membrane beta-barrel protein [Saprospiraceae bacterium]